MPPFAWYGASIAHWGASCHLNGLHFERIAYRIVSYPGRAGDRLSFGGAAAIPPIPQKGAEGTLGGSASQAHRLRASPLEIPILGRVRGPRGIILDEEGKRHFRGTGNERQPCGLFAQAQSKRKHTLLETSAQRSAARYAMLPKARNENAAQAGRREDDGNCIEALAGKALSSFALSAAAPCNPTARAPPASYSTCISICPSVISTRVPRPSSDVMAMPWPNRVSTCLQRYRPSPVARLSLRPL